MTAVIPPPLGTQPRAWRCRETSSCAPHPAAKLQLPASVGTSSLCTSPRANASQANPHHIQLPPSTGRSACCQVPLSQSSSPRPRSASSPSAFPLPPPPGGPHGWGWGTGRAPGCAVSLTPFSSPHGGLESRNKTRREWHAQFCSRPTSACSVLTSTPRCWAETHRSEESCEPPSPRPPHPKQLLRGCGTAALRRDQPGRGAGTACSAKGSRYVQDGDGLRGEEAATVPTSPASERRAAPSAAPHPPPARLRAARTAEGGKESGERCQGRTPGSRGHRGGAKARRCENLGGVGGGKPQGSASARRSAFPAAALAHRAQHAVPRGEAKRCTSRTCTPPNPPPPMVRNCPRRRNRGGREHQPRGAARCFVPRERQRMRRSASPPDGRSPAQRLRGRGRRERGENKARNESQRAPLIAREGRERGGFRGLPPGRATCGTRERHGRALRPQCKQQSRGRVPLLNPRVSQLRAAPTPRHRSAPTGVQRCSP